MCKLLYFSTFVQLLQSINHDFTIFKKSLIVPRSSGVRQGQNQGHD